MHFLAETFEERERGHDFALQRRGTLIKASRTAIRQARAYGSGSFSRLGFSCRAFDQEILRCELLY
jgi:hypothetical protein